MQCHIKIWSRIGHTPLTKRRGSYCDLILDTQFDCDTPEQAKVETKRLMAETPHSDRGWFNMPEYWNQNIRTNWL